MLFVWSVLMISGAYAQTIMLSPDPLHLDIFATGNMTATLSEPAPPGGLTLNVEAVPGLSIVTPPYVNIPEGLTSTTFVITARGAEGVEQVIISTPDSTSGSATVIVTRPVEERTCKDVTGDTISAARVYIKALNAAEHSCTKEQTDCAAAVAEATMALDFVIQSHTTVSMVCR